MRTEEGVSNCVRDTRRLKDDARNAPKAGLGGLVYRPQREETGHGKTETMYARQEDHPPATVLRENGKVDGAGRSSLHPDGEERGGGKLGRGSDERNRRGRSG